jgi:hypothetical protein
MMAGATDLGIFEFSTFSDSGQLTFKFEGYDDPVRNAACKVAEGTKAVSATSMTTNVVDLSVDKTSNAFMAGTSVCAGG